MPPAGDFEGQALELLTAIRDNADEAKRYLGGIFGLLQSQESLSSTLGDLAPMVMQMFAGAGAPTPPNGAPAPSHPVIEADRG